jgi:hypothetical protein
MGSRLTGCSTLRRLFQSEAELAEIKSQAKLIFRRLSRSSEPQASIECGDYTLQYGRSAFISLLER